jgi:hypothetical protein
VKPLKTVLAIAALAVLLGHGQSSAATLGSPTLGGSGYSPRVPVSPLAFRWFDPSRLQMTSTFSVGTGFGGRTDALQVTRFAYNFGAPLQLAVSVGNSFGPSAGLQQGKFFLEGLDATYRPNPNMVFQVHYQDYRSPLQRSFGAAPFGSSTFDGDWGR